MVRQAQTELPNECCGLLAGRVTDDQVGVVTRRFPLVNSPASPTLYNAEPGGLVAAMRAIREEGLELLAIYHSHPATGPVPSRTDRERNYYGDTVVHLIIGLGGPVPVMRAWRLTADEAVEMGWGVTESPGALPNPPSPFPKREGGDPG
jgi:proteasome lid subunit RPN8/RPN11